MNELDRIKQIKVLRATEADYEELVDVSNLIFSVQTDQAGNRTYNHRFFQDLLPKLYRDASCSMPAHYLIREHGDSGKILAAAGAFDNILHVGEHPLHIRGIGTVGVHPDYRGCGYMKAIMYRMLADCVHDGVDFSFLGGLRQRYEHFGFATTGNCASFTMTAGNMDYIYGKQASFGYAFRPISPEQTALLDRIDALHRAQRVHAERKREKLHDILINWGRRPLAIFRGDVFCGWCITEEDGGALYEITLADPDALGEVLCDYIRSFSLNSVTLQHIGLYETEKINYLAKHAENLTLTHHEQYQIFRYENMLRAFLTLKAAQQGLCDGTLTLEITNGDFAQKLCIRVRDNCVTVTPHTGEAEYRMDALLAAQVFFGVGAAMTDFSLHLPPFARQWFPLPLCHIDADGV